MNTLKAVMKFWAIMQSSGVEIMTMGVRVNIENKIFLVSSNSFKISKKADSIPIKKMCNFYY